MYPAGGGKGERTKLMEKEAISSDAEMVGLPQSGGGRRQRMAAGGGDTDLSQEDRSTVCSAASPAIHRPDGLPRDSEQLRPGAEDTPVAGASNRSQDDNKAAAGCSREGNKVAAGRLHGGPNRVAADRLRGGKSIFAVRRGREMAEGSEPDGSEEDCRNGGAAEETAAIGEIDWEDEELWLGALAEAGISWSGTMREFCESETMSESARGQWEDGMDRLRSRMLDTMADSEVRDPVVRIAGAFREAFETVNWKAREHRFAAFISETMENAGGDQGSTERLAAVEEEISELEERLRELKAEQQELLEQQELSEHLVTVRNLAWNVTSDMLRGTFEQVAELVDAEVQYDEESGRSLGWGVVEFGEAADAVEAAERFQGVELASRPMVIEIGDGRELDGSQEGEPEGGLDQCEQ
jgi:hypothetical protein